MSSVTSKYDVDSKAYYILFSTVEIVPVEIIKIHYNSVNSSEPISYKIRLINRLNPTYIDFVEESRLLTFNQAKSSLLSWLESEKTLVTNLIEPTL